QFDGMCPFGLEQGPSPNLESCRHRFGVPCRKTEVEFRIVIARNADDQRPQAGRLATGLWCCNILSACSFYGGGRHYFLLFTADVFSFVIGNDTQVVFLRWVCRKPGGVNRKDD